MAAVAAPSVEVKVTPSAAKEIKNFMTSEDDLPETADFAFASFPAAVRVFNIA